MTQAELAEKVGRDVKTVRNWEAGRRSPRSILGMIEKALAVDLSEPGTPGPTLDDATDTQIIASLAGRLADRDRVIRDQETELERLRNTTHEKASTRWAARTREPDRGDGT